MVSLPALIGLSLAFGAKQLAADFFLQTGWMARGKGQAQGWLAPLGTHACVHGLGTLLITLAMAPKLWWLSLVDVVLHAAIDRVKALPSLGGRWTPQHCAYWWAFGVDQQAHALTHLGFVVLLLTA